MHFSATPLWHPWTSLFSSIRTFCEYTYVLFASVTLWIKFSKIVQYISFNFLKVVSFHLMNSHISEDWVKKLSLISNPKYLPCFRTISKFHLISIFMVWIMYVINHDYDLMTKALFWCSARIVYIYHCAPKNVKVHDKINVL